MQHHPFAGPSTTHHRYNRRARAPAPACAHARTTPDRSWLREYVTGCSYNIFEASVGPDFEAVPFVEAAEWLYRVCGIVLIGARLSVGGLSACGCSTPSQTAEALRGGTVILPTQHAAATTTHQHTVINNRHPAP